MDTLNSQQIEIKLCELLEDYRLMKNISQAALAEQAGVSRRTISRMENGEGVSLDTFIRVMVSLGLGDNLQTLIPETSIRPIERVKQKQQRQRASSKRSRPESHSSVETEWQWNES